MKMSKKALALMICFIMLLGTVAVGGDGIADFLKSFGVTAKAVSVSDLTYVVNTEEGTISITGCNAAASGELVIPGEIDEIIVTDIGDEAFKDCTGITNAVLPESIENIGASAFCGCSGLTSVIIPDGVYDIGEAAFKDCSSLISAVIPESLDYSLSASAFEGCASLESVTIPNSVNYIGISAFDGCTSLQTVIYEGTETEFNKIWIAAGNTEIENATVQYGSVGHPHTYRRYYDDNGIYIDYCIICGKTKKLVYTEGAYKNKSKKGSIESAYSKKYNTTASNGSPMWFSKIRLTSLNDNKVRITAICRDSNGNKVKTTHYGVFVSKNKQLLEKALKKSLTSGQDSSPDQYDDLNDAYSSHKDEILKIYKKEEANDSLLNIFINGEGEVGDTSMLDPDSTYYYVLFYWKSTGRKRVAGKLNWFKTNQAHSGKYSKVNGDDNGNYSGSGGAYKVGDFCGVQTRNISTSHATIRAEIAKTYNNCLTNVGGTGFYLSKNKSDVEDHVSSAHYYKNIINQEDVMIDGSHVVEIWYSIGGADGKKIAPYSYCGYTFKGNDLADFYGKLECNTKYYWRLYYYTGSNRNSNRKYSAVNWFITDDHIPQYDWETVKPPTCEEPGKAVKKCVACKKILEEQEIPALDHAYPINWTDKGDGTGTGDGTHEKVCARDSSHVMTANHNWVESSRTDPVPPDQDGEILYTCVDCSATYTEPIPVDSVFTPVTVRFFKRDGTLVDTQTGYAGTAMTLPPGPEEEGNSFIGWYSQSNIKAGDTFPPNDTDYTARYRINSYTITYKLDGAYYPDSENAVDTFEYNSRVTIKSKAVKTGCTVSDWEFTPALKEENRMPASNIVANATSTPNVYSAYFFIDYPSQTVPYEAVPVIDNIPYMTAVPMPAKPADNSHYTYGEWLADDGYIMDSTNGKYYYSSATPVSYTVTFLDKDGGTISTETIGFGNGIPFPEAPDVTGHTVTGWKRLSDEVTLTGDELSDETMPAHDETYQAVYTPNQYTITYKLDGEYYPDSGNTVDTFEYDSPVTIRLKASKTGYTVTNWSFEKEDGTPVSISANDHMPAYNIIAKATSSVNSYTITYKVNGAEYYESPYTGAADTYHYNDTVSVRPRPVIEGYTVSDWVITPALNGGKMPASNVVASATKTANSYTVTFTYGSVNNYAVYKTITLPYGSAVTAPADPEFTGYTFTGWEAEIPSTMPAQNLTINALWALGRYTVTYMLDGVEYIGEGYNKAFDTYYFGETVTPRNKAVKEGYTVTGWAFTPALTDGDKMPGVNVVANASSTPLVYRITYKLDGQPYYGGTISASDSFSCGSPVTLRGKAAKTGYSVTPWSFKKEDGSSVSITAGNPMPAYNIIAEAASSPQSFKITYNIDNVFYTEKTYYCDSDVEKLTPPERQGYVFSGWNPSEPVKMPANNLILNGYYYPNTDTPYTVETHIMNLSGGYDVSSVKYPGTTGDPVTVEDKYTNPGIGFTLNEDESVQEGIVKGDGTLVLKVVFDRNQYTVTYKLDGEDYPDNESASDTFYFGGAVTLRDNPVAEPGYTIPDWELDSEIPDGKMPAYNVTANTNTIPNKYRIIWNYYEASKLKTYDYKSQITVLTPPEREGYTFRGWSEDGKNIAEIPETMPMHDLEYTAIYDPINYTIYYDVDGEPDLSREIQYPCDAAITNYNPEKPGYIFSGWIPEEPVTMPPYDIYTFGSFEKSTNTPYTVETYIMNVTGKYDMSSSPYTGTTEETVSAEGKFINPGEGFTFNSEKSIMTGTISGDGSLVLKVFFDRNQYKLTYKLDGEEYIGEGYDKASDTYYYGETVVQRPNAVKIGSDVSEWSLKTEENESPVSIETGGAMPAYNIIAQATSTRIKYFVTWKYDSNSSVSSYYYGDTIKEFTPPEKVGYTYSPWEPEVESTMPAHNLEYSCTSSPNTYTLTVNYEMSDGKNDLAPATYTDGVVFGESYSVTSHSVTGYTPDKSVVEGVMDEEGKTVTVTYSPNPHTVTWIVDGEETPVDYHYGDEIEKPADPEKEGYTFKGWSEDGETVIEIPETVPDEDLEFIAVFSVNSYTITYKLDGEAYPDSENAVDTFEYNSPVTIRSKASKTGYTVTNWSLEKEDGATVAISANDLMPAYNIIANATSTVNSYTITLTYGSVNNGAEYDKITQNYGTDIATPADPTFKGYIFIGWDADIPAKMPAEDKTINALWAPNTYTLTVNYVMSDGKNELAPATYTDGVVFGESYSVTSLSVTGYTPDKAAVEGTMDEEGKTVTVTYSPNPHTVTWIVDGEETPVDYHYGDEIEKPADPVKEGYSFNGWSEDGETVIEIPETVPDEDLVFIAVFSVNTYKVTYILDDEEYIGEGYDKAYDTFEYNSEVSIRNKAVKSGCDVSDWVFTPALKEDNRMPACDVVASAVSSANSFTLTIKYEMSDGKNELAPATYTDSVVFGAEYNVPSPSVTGYTPDKAVVEGVMDEEGKTVTVTYSPNPHTVTWIADGEETPVNYHYGDPIEKPTDPEKEGYTFKGWSEDGETVIDIPTTVPDEDLEFIAVFSVNSYKVTYILDGEEYLGEGYNKTYDSFEYGSVVSVRPKALKEGHTVSDWVFTPALKEDNRMPACDVVANAVSTVNTYTVTWIVEGREPDIVTYEYGATINIPDDPEIPGKVFIRWVPDVPETMPARNLEFEAKFDAITHTATFVAENPSGSYSDETGTYAVVDTVIFKEGQETIPEPAVPEKDGYTGEWEEYELCTEDIVIKAIYKINPVPGPIDTEKTAEENGDGTVTITLNAYSKAKEIKTDAKSQPLDVVIIVDQSGSMKDPLSGGKSKKEELQKQAKALVEELSENASATDADHRVAVVGFAMGGKDATDSSGYYPPYLNTGILTSPDGNTVNYKDANDEDYQNALLSVKNNESLILNAIDNSQASGATAADLGFDMASKIFANSVDNAGETERKRIVIFITDGVPTTASSFDSGVADCAITRAKHLKENGVTVYTIAISDDANPNNTTRDFNRFLHATSSNYQSASSVNALGEGKNEGYFLTAKNASELGEKFESISGRIDPGKVGFYAVTLYDTVKPEFTMTAPQEKEFRERMIAKYGISSSDITIDRRDDGTTYVEVRRITPYAYYDSANVQQGWKADVSFNVTANENAVDAGIYPTNTDEAGVIIDNYTVGTFESPEVEFSDNRSIVEFIVGSDTYEIREINIGDEIIAPECKYADWNIPAGTTATERIEKFYADYTTEDKTVTWYIGDKPPITQHYARGQVIVPPNVNTETVITGWSPEVEICMGYTDLEYTALFGSHDHIYNRVSYSGTCTEGRTITYKCSVCKATYTEELPPCDHQFESVAYETSGATFLHIFCKNCLYSQRANLLTFTVSSIESGYFEGTVADLHAEVINDEAYDIRIPLASLSNRCRRHKDSIVVTHFKSDVGAGNQQVKETCPYVIDGDYIVVRCTSFSYYVFTVGEVDERITNDALDYIIRGETPPADYSALDALLATIPDDLSDYTDISVAALNDVIAGIDRTFTMDEQETVDGYVDAVAEAIDSLRLEPAASISSDKIIRGQKATWTVVTTDEVEWLRFTNNYTTSAGASGTVITGCEYGKAKIGSTEIETSDEDGMRTWTVTMPFTYPGTAASADEVLTVEYKRSGSNVWESVNVKGEDGVKAPYEQNILVAKSADIFTPPTPEHEKFELVSAQADTEAGTFTVVTTDDVSKIRISYTDESTGKTKSCTYQSTSSSVISCESENGLTTWVVKFKTDVHAENNTYTVQSRGPAWGEGKTVII